jgi:endonuclease YncB( thermonuclease family)
MPCLALLLSLGMSLGLADQPLRPDREAITIRMVVNTNTVVVSTVKDPTLWVTLLGVGTPETIDPRKPGYLLGKPDLQWLASWLAPGTRAHMERRGETTSGRPLVFLYRLEDGYCWNAHLIKVGAAFAARQVDFSEFEKLASMEADAQHEGKGLWKGYSPPAPIRPVREPNEVVSGTYRTERPQSFDPSHFPPHAKKRYASQAANRLANQQILGQMMQGGGNGFGQGYYVGPRQPPGHYAGGVGSSHKGGTYINSYTGNRYQRSN